MSTSVKYITNAQRGAPAISGTAGTLIAALDALFTTGWGVTTAISVNVASGIATATLTSGETFDKGAVVLVAGATPSGLNGEARVLSSSLTSITWATTAADGVATGTITIKYAPQTSWEKVFSATNKAVYRSTHVQSNGHFLRIDDTGTTSSRVCGYETMTDVNSGTGPFPTDAQMSGGGYWMKSSAANSTAVPYHIFCDERMVLSAIAVNISGGVNTIGRPLRGFGDLIPLAAGGDAWATILSCADSTGVSYQQLGTLDNSYPTEASGIFAPRAYTALGASIKLDNRPESGKTNSVSGLDSAMGAMPSEIDGEVKTMRMLVREQGTGKPPRAVVPGVYYLPQTNGTMLGRGGDTLEGSGALAGRHLMVMPTDAGYNTQYPLLGAYLVDVTGPWR